MSRLEVISGIKKSIFELDRQQKLKGKKLVLFGVNPYLESIVNSLYKVGYQLVSIIDNDKKKQGSYWADIEVRSPYSIDWNEDYVILIASQYIKDMEQQIKMIADQIPIYSLFDFHQYNRVLEYKKKFWIQENFTFSKSRLFKGKCIYEQIKTEEKLFLSPTISIGDSFLWSLYFKEYCQRENLTNYKIVAASLGARRVLEMFEYSQIIQLKKEDMDCLTEFIFFMGEKETNTMVIYPRHEVVRCLDVMASYKGMVWQQIYAKFLFHLGNQYKMNFPSINKTDSHINFEQWKQGKTVILSPYANTVGELPMLFWDRLVIALRENNYDVYTNVVGMQKALNGTKSMEIPLESIGTYLKNAGYFIALRNGLCDVAGQADCKKIIIFRNRRQIYNSELEFNDLRVDGVAKNIEYLVYEDASIQENIDQIMEYMRKI